MAIALEFRWDSRELSVFRGRAVDGALARAIRLAGNQGIRVTQRESIAYVKGRKLIRDEDVKKGLPLALPKRSGTINDLVWEMRARGVPVSLARFPHIDTRLVGGRGRGVIARINVGGGGSRLAGAFQIARTRSAQEAVFMRTGKARLPIRKVSSSSLSDVMRDPGAADAALRKGYEKMLQAWPKGMSRELAKLRGKGGL